MNHYSQLDSVLLFEGMTHEQEFENIEQVLPFILDFVRE